MNAVEQKMAELSERFAARASGERAAIERALEQEDQEQLRDLAHKLAGSAAMFGHPAIGEAALSLELAAEEGASVAQAAHTLCEMLARIEPGA